MSTVALLLSLTALLPSFEFDSERHGRWHAMTLGGPAVWLWIFAFALAAAINLTGLATRHRTANGLPRHPPA
jgi:hypothetical protein